MSDQQTLMVLNQVYDLLLLGQELLQYEKLLPRLKTHGATNKLSSPNEKALKNFKDKLLSRRFSPQTVKGYYGIMKLFLLWNQPLTWDQIQEENIVNFNVNYLLKSNHSISYQRVFTNAIKSFYKYNYSTSIAHERLVHPRSEKKVTGCLHKIGSFQYFRSHN